MPKFASANEGLPYLVEPILPIYQDKGIEHYISVTPESDSLNQEFEFLVANKTNEVQQIDVKLLNAYTSGNGGIQYAPDGTENNFIIDGKYELRKYVESPEMIELQGGERKVVKLKVNVPSSIEGTILGAVAFQVAGEQTQTKEEGISFEIKNEINTVYGIAVNFPINKDYEFKFGKPFVDPMPSYYAIRLPITLDSPLLLKDADIKYKVFFKGKELFFGKEKIDFAPMTKTNFSIPFEHEKIEHNKPYVLKGEVTYKDQNGMKQTKKFTHEFVYKKDNQFIGKGFNTLKVPVEDVPFPIWMILLVLGFFIIILWLRRRKKDDDKKKSRGEND